MLGQLLLGGSLLAEVSTAGRAPPHLHSRGQLRAGPLMQLLLLGRAAQELILGPLPLTLWALSDPVGTKLKQSSVCCGASAARCSGASADEGAESDSW